MTFKTIIVHVDETQACASRLKLAVSLAAAYEAHLTGLYVATSLFISPYAATHGGQRIREMHMRAAEEAKAKAEAMFRDATESAAISAEWRAEEGYASDVVSLHARYADLTIVGQTDPDLDLPTSFANLPEHVVLAIGRPVLVVPYAGQFQKIGQRVIVAWDGSREAARAANDALPFLEKAKRVRVLVINPRSGPAAHGDVPGADISQHLARHGVKVEADSLSTEVPGAKGSVEGSVEFTHGSLSTAVAHIYADDMTIGDVLLSQTAEEAADLIVMGAYGQPRIRKMIMGGVTNHILRQMTVPVLMSH